MNAWLSRLDQFFPVRYTLWSLSLLATVWFAFSWILTGKGAVPAIVCAGLAAVGIRDMLQSKHSMLRNYPLVGHLRFLLEFIRPEIRQYFIESDNEETPFSRQQRSIVYQRAKGEPDKRPFGTQIDDGDLAGAVLVPITRHDDRSAVGETREDAALGVAAHVTFLGALSDMATFYRGIDCLLHLPLTEAFGLVAVEAADFRAGRAADAVEQPAAVDGVEERRVDRPGEHPAVVGGPALAAVQGGLHRCTSSSDSWEGPSGGMDCTPGGGAGAAE